MVRIPTGDRRGCAVGVSDQVEGEGPVTAPGDGEKSEKLARPRIGVE